MRIHNRLFAVVTPVALAAMMGLSVPAYGNFVEFTGTNAGQPVHATANFDTSVAGFISLTLTNLQATISASQVISDIFFNATGLTGGTGFYANNGSVVAPSFINVASDGSFAAGAAPVPNAWQLTNTSSLYHLNVLCGAGCSGPAGTIIGPPSGTDYSSANSSIKGSGPHNPFANQSATFLLSIPTLAANAIITDVTFSFGTDNVTVPIPAAVWLFASGLVGLIGIARRKLGAQAMAA